MRYELTFSFDTDGEELIDPHQLEDACSNFAAALAADFDIDSVSLEIA